MTMPTAKIWNPPRWLRSPDCVNPFAVAIFGNWFLKTEDGFHLRSRSLVEMIEREGLPAPVHVEEPREEAGSRTIAIVHYNSAGEAHAVVTSFFWTHYEMDEYGVPELKPIFIEGVDYFQRTSQGLEPEWVASTVKPIIVDTQVIEDQHESATAREMTQRSSSTSSYISESSAGETSASSDYSFVSGYDATGNHKRKRKRIGGFVCQASSCSMIFDRECDRRKHEKVHSDDRAYVCPECNKGFHWPKDLRRHERRHHANRGLEHAGTASSSLTLHRPEEAIPMSQLLAVEPDMVEGWNQSEGMTDLS